MAFHLVNISGTGPGGDIFNFGFGVEDSTGTTQDVADGVADSFTSKFATPFASSSFKNQFSSQVHFLNVTAYRRSKTPGGPADEVAEKALVSLDGSGGGTSMPPEIAVCVSLLTGLPGRSNRGRMYLPTPSVNAGDSPGTITPTSQQVFSLWAAAFFGDVNTTARHVVVWSRKNASSKNVTQVSVGNQFDVQRRRQNAQPESYVATPVSGI